MIYMVIGTQNSGKSELAEKLAMETGDDNKIYLATMKIYDKSGHERVKKHRLQREGKGFITIEHEYNLLAVLDKIDTPKETTILLECVSNLVGNELFENKAWNEKLLKHLNDPDLYDRKKEFADIISKDIKNLSGQISNLIIVTNEYDYEGSNYDDETRLYVELLSMVNERIIRFSDKVYDLRKGRKS